MPFLSYWFWPRPGVWHYGETKVIVLLAICAVLVVLSFVLSRWRSKLKNPVTRMLTRSWSGASLWFGIVGVFLIVCRVEDIQFLEMRAVQALWVLVFALYIVFQAFQFRRRHYTVMERSKVIDERDKYLPKKKR